jgi:hypothetical protein
VTPRLASVVLETRERSASVTLDLVAFDIIPSGTRFAALNEHVLGGLSACAFDSGRARMLALSDSRARPAVFELSLELTMGLRVVPAGVIPLETKPDHPRAPGLLDGEGLVRLDHDRWLVSSEGDGESEAPGVYEYSGTGRFLGALPVPARLMPDRLGSRQRRGPRSNLAFESLTRLPDGRILTGIEAPLLQDDDPADRRRGAWCRLAEFVPDRGAWRPGRQFAYPIDPMRVPADFEAPEIETGLVELLGLADQHLLALERGFAIETRGARRSVTVIRVYDVSLAAATDISRRASLRGRPAVVPVAKSLVLDLDDLTPRLPASLARLENFEAMCFGPDLPDGGTSVLLVSDDNFSARQRTVFLLFRLGHGGTGLRKARATETRIHDGHGG